MALITAVINFKGGVAKTTTTMNLGAGLKKLKERVLVIDTDPQGNIAVNLQGSEESILNPQTLTISALYQNPNIDPNNAIVKGAYFDYIPNNLYAYQRTNGMSDYRLLKQIIDKVKHNYDHIIIDTPPYLGLDAINAIYAADTLMLVTDFSKASLTGVQILVSVLDKWHDKQISSVFKNKPKTILFTMHQKNTVLHRELLESVEDSKAVGMGIMLKERIPRLLKVVEDGYSGVPTIISNPRNKVATEYKSLAETWYYARTTGKITGSRYMVNVPRS
ncbi:MAG: ParA family protein [Arcicella sp.]|jgi:chromosome partitioning protein|nr:ParA family protein [Arcicella sp.]